MRAWNQISGINTYNFQKASSFQENIAILGFPEICRRVVTLPKLSQIGGETPCTQNNIRLLEAPISVKYYEKAKTWFSIFKNLASFLYTWDLMDYLWASPVK